MFDKPFPFLDSDVYKWLEGAGWELGRSRDPRIAAMADEAIGLVAGRAAPRRLPQHVRPGARPGLGVPGPRVGPRALLLRPPHPGGPRLAPRARRRPSPRRRRACGRIRRARPRSGWAGRPSTAIPRSRWPSSSCTGRPASGDYLDLAATFLERRGRGLLGAGRFGRAYWQDHRRSREAPSVAGHAVRQLYLDCGAVDVAVELGDRRPSRRGRAPLARHGRDADVPHRRPRQPPPGRGVRRSRTSCRPTGPTPRRARRSPRRCSPGGSCSRPAIPRAPTCIERTIYNGVLPGLSLDGTSFFYVNPLQRRTASRLGRAERRPAGAVVRLRVLPAQPDADDRLVPRRHRDDRRRRHPAPPVRRRRDRRGRARGPCTDRRRDRLPVGRAGRGRPCSRRPADPWTLGLRVPGWASAATVRPPDGDPVSAAGGRSVETPVVAGRRHR